MYIIYDNVLTLVMYLCEPGAEGAGSRTVREDHTASV